VSARLVFTWFQPFNRQITLIITMWLVTT